MTYYVPHLIAGKKLAPAGKQLDIFDPSLGECVGHVNVADQSIVNNAVAEASTAFKTWSQTSSSQRTKILFKYKTLLDKNIDELATLVTREHGKTLIEAKGSVQRGIDVAEYACGITQHLKGAYSNEVAKDIDCYSLYQPLGVCVGITPFNFPAMIPLWMFPLAIACGNTFILKPSEKDPSCAVKLVELAHEAGVPPGVLNVIHGDKETVDALITHPNIQAISFVGSSAIAEQVYKTGIMHNKRVQAFGGAKNHCVVMPDADVDQAAEQIVMSAYGSAGERCMAISVVVTVGDEIADKLIAKMAPQIKQLKIGAGTLPDIDMGPLVTDAHLARVKSYIDLGKQEGAKLIVDGSDYKPKENPQGFFMGGCLFDAVTPLMRIYKEEIFGPVLCIVRVPDLKTAIQLTNEHEYGNGVAIFTRDGYTARTFVEAVQVGMVGINVPVPVPVPSHSFGGWKRSIFSDIGMYGQEAVRFYTKLKTVTQRWYAAEKA